MSTIICPYCCKRFEPDEVHFRFKASQKQEKEEIRDDDELRLRRRSSHTELQVRNEGRVLDEYLLKYYNEFGAPADSGNFESYSMQLPYIEFDRLNPKLTYDFAAYEEYGFINKIKVGNQILDERLCPYCHNRVVEGAGKQEMHMVSVVGNTSAGKSVYLAILSKIVGEDKILNASVFFKGNEQEEEYYYKNYKSLVKEKKMLHATVGIVPPVPFEIDFIDPVTGQKRSIMIVFRDIMGESVQNLRDLGLTGKHLKESSGLLYLIDPTGFDEVAQKVTKRPYNGGSQAESLQALKRFLTGEEYEDVTSIPTAVVITKSDIISDMLFFSNDRYLSLVNDDDWRGRHPGYIKEKRIRESDEGVKDFLKNISEEEYISNIEDTFKNSSFFMCSSLGFDPDVRQSDWSEIDPFNVTEPFYWLLGQLGVLPYKMRRTYFNKRKNQEKNISIFYYKTDSQEKIEERFAEKLKAEGMVSFFPWDKWVIKA